MKGGKEMSKEIEIIKHGDFSQRVLEIVIKDISGMQYKRV